ncbi:MAG: hypothetical protein ABI863_16655 [Ginsengibacter sp.]
MYKFVFILFFFLILQKISFAQDTLPKVSVTQRSNKVLISWTNAFASVTTINIQRSYDSLKNFTTIGSVLNVTARSNGFVDAKVFIPPQYYRLFISFEGGTYIFTQSHRPGIDTLKTIPEVTEIQPSVKTWFVPSKRVYTGKDNNVIIALPDAEKKKYSIKFFEEDGSPIFELKKITESWLTLDKVNFLHAGLFNFEIYSDGVLMEKHKVYIPKDGKPVPALDEYGHAVK